MFCGSSDALSAYDLGLDILPCFLHGFGMLSFFVCASGCLSPRNCGSASRWLLHALRPSVATPPTATRHSPQRCRLPAARCRATCRHTNRRHASRCQVTLLTFSRAGITSADVTGLGVTSGDVTQKWYVYRFRRFLVRVPILVVFGTCTDFGGFWYVYRFWRFLVKPRLPNMLKGPGNTNPLWTSQVCSLETCNAERKRTARTMEATRKCYA